MGRRFKLASTAAVLAAAIFLSASEAQAGNIITFAANASKCGGAVMCSGGDGTTGYYNDGTGTPFNLSAIGNWFQIDLGGKNLLPSQAIPEPDKGAGSFLVTNDTGGPISSFSLTLFDDFTSKTASVHPCSGAQKGNVCDNFTAHGGSGSYTYDTELSGTDWDHCTQGTVSGQTCTGKAGGVAADFAPGSTTYTWTAEPGKSIPAGGNFTISFSGWNNDGTTYYSICNNVAGNLIQNCGFETDDLTDWSAMGAGFAAVIVPDPNSGHYSAALADEGGVGGSISQAFTSVSGVTYNVTFYIKALIWGTGSSFGVQVLGSNGTTTLGSWSASVSNSYADWTKESFTFTGDGSTDSLSVILISTGPEEFLVDDFSVVAE